MIVQVSLCFQCSYQSFCTCCLGRAPSPAASVLIYMRRQVVFLFCLVSMNIFNEFQFSLSMPWRDSQSGSHFNLCGNIYHVCSRTNNGEDCFASPVAGNAKPKAFFCREQILQTWAQNRDTYYFRGCVCFWREQRYDFVLHGDWFQWNYFRLQTLVIRM